MLIMYTGSHNVETFIYAHNQNEARDEGRSIARKRYGDPNYLLLVKEQ